MKAYTTKRQAIKAIRESAGVSIATATATVNNMPTRMDGKRAKISTRDLQKEIARLSAPPPRYNAGIKPLSERQKKLIWEAAEARRAAILASAKERR